jgi:hypothetical protein
MKPEDIAFGAVPGMLIEIRDKLDKLIANEAENAAAHDRFQGTLDSHTDILKQHSNILKSVKDLMVRAQNT